MKTYPLSETLVRGRRNGCGQLWEDTGNTSWARGSSFGRTRTRQSGLPLESLCSYLPSFGPLPWRMLMYQGVGPLWRLLQAVERSSIRANNFWKHCCLFSCQCKGYFCDQIFSNKADSNIQQWTTHSKAINSAHIRIASGGKVLRNYSDELRLKIYQEQEERK